MINLPEVTLIAVTGHKFSEHEKAIKKSCEGINFGAVKIIYDFGMNHVDVWSKEIVFNLGDYIQTSHALLIHADGYVIHPELWNPEWLELDYIGSPFPLPTDDYSYRDPFGKIQRVGNSVSLRSKKLMQLPKKIGMEWKSYYDNWNEDGFISVHNRHIFEAHGCEFGTFEQALKFGKEHELPENKGLSTFVFHKVG